MHTYLLQQLYPKHLIYRRGNLKMNHNFTSVFSSVVGRPVPERPGAEPKSFCAPAGAPGQYASAPRPGPNQK